MSKPLAPGQTPAHLEPAQQVRLFANLYRDVVNPAVYTRLAVRVRQLDLGFSDDELLVLAALDTPARVQAFLNTQIYYNNDHASAEQEETSMSPRRVLQTALAHCFESRCIQVDAQGQPFVSVSDLPAEAQELWDAFWRVHEPEARPRGQAREIERQFRRLFHTTPLDLQENAEDLVYFFERGYRIEQLLMPSS